VEIALDVLQWNQQGVPLKDIRTRIDSKYSKYGIPTPTPPVE
jgi:hypothetical protein